MSNDAAVRIAATGSVAFTAYLCDGHENSCCRLYVQYFLALALFLFVASPVCGARRIWVRNAAE